MHLCVHKFHQIGTEIMKIFIPVILFYGNKNVCVGFA